MEERKKVVLIETERTGYAPDQIDGTLTVGDLMEILQSMDEDTPIMLCNDHGYTYGGIRWASVFEAEYDEEGSVYRNGREYVEEY